MFTSLEAYHIINILKLCKVLLASGMQKYVRQLSGNKRLPAYQILCPLLVFHQMTTFGSV